MQGFDNLTDIEDSESDQDDFWDRVGLHCSSYSSDQDDDLIRVFIETASDCTWYTTIAEKLNLDEKYVRLLMEILCAANYCEYGTSPRGAWAIRSTYKENLAKLRAEYAKTWGRK